MQMVYSPLKTITQGIPQGSVLGPLFYIIYANDIPNVVKNCGIALYADDTVLFIANTNIGNTVSNLQEDKLIMLNNVPPKLSLITNIWVLH